ncbi:MAG: IPT/TIG domain-containing protein [Myxococcaceae bacterium]
MRRALAFFLLASTACPTSPEPTDGGNDKPAPSISSITPDKGSAAGGTMVTLSGANFQSGANVSIGGAPATQVFVNGPLSLTARTPAGAPGKADITVLNPDGKHATLAQAFTYQPVVNASITEALTLNPLTASDTTGASMVSVTVVGVVEVPGVTSGAGQGAGVLAQVGYATQLSNPPAITDFLWAPATYSGDADGAATGDQARDQYQAALQLPGATGMEVKTYWLASRFSLDNGNVWAFGDHDGLANGFTIASIPELDVSRAQVGWCKLGGETVTAPDQLNLKEGAAPTTVYAQVYAKMVTDSAGQGANIKGQVGYGAPGSDPSTWAWVDATWNKDTGSGANDEYQAALPTPAAGSYAFAYRFSLNAGPYLYCDADGADNGFTASQCGSLQVTPTGVDFCNLQFPVTLNLKEGDSSGLIYGRVFGINVTEAAGAGPGLAAEVGYGPTGTLPDPTWSWSTASYNQEEPNGQEEWQGSFTAPVAGSYGFAYRFSYDGGSYVYCDLDGTTNGVTVAQLGAMTVTAVGIDDCQLEGPAALNTTPGGMTTAITALVHSAGLTDGAGQAANIVGEVGYGPTGSTPSGWSTWSAAAYVSDQSTSDRYSAAITAPNTAGSFDVAYRFRYGTGGYAYCDLDGSGNGYSSAQASHLSVGAPAVQQCNLQFVDQTATPSGDPVTAYGRVLVPGVTPVAGAAPGLRAQFGVGTQGDNASSSSLWGWAEAKFNLDTDGGEDEWWQTVTPAYTGTRAVSFRVSLDDGGSWTYCDVNGSNVNGYEVNQQWALQVNNPSVFDYCNLQFPATMTLDAGQSGTVYGQVYAAGLTPNGALPLVVQYGRGNSQEDPGLAWTWAQATFNAPAGNNNEYQGQLSAPPGTWSYAFRYSFDGGSWCFGDLDGNGSTFMGAGAGFSGGSNLGTLTVLP